MGYASKSGRGKFVVITGPSAAGKTVLVDALLERILSSARLITITTRKPRPHETNGVDYIFVNRKEFEEKIKRGELFEYAEVYGQLYGSSREDLMAALKEHEYVFAVVDIQGAHTIRRELPDALIIFLLPGSLEDIRRRLASRVSKGGIVDEGELKRRIKEAGVEMEHVNAFDYVLENVEGKFGETVNMAEDIIESI